jgi:hypothetical protein
LLENQGLYDTKAVNDHQELSLESYLCLKI